MDRVLHSLVCVAFFTGWFLIQFVMFAFPGVTTYDSIMAAWPVYSLLFMLPYSLFARAYYQKRTGLMPFGRPQWADFRLPLIMVSIIFIAGPFFVEENDTWLQPILTPSPFHQFMMTIYIIFAAPVIEEIIFRGFLLNAGIGYGPAGRRAAIIITSLLFSLIHTQYDSPATYILIFILSVVFCQARIQTNSLLVPIILHMLYNGMSMLIIFTTMT